jgi:hypothetical protein
MTKPNSAEIICVVDRSGSMDGIWDDTVGGLHKFIDKQREFKGEAKISIAFFDTEYDLPFNGVDVKSEVFNNKSCFDEYRPRGWTALLDAIGKTISDVGTRLSKTPEHERPDKVTMCVITDGQENASREFTNAKIREMIKHQTDKYQWEFIYLGANQDAFAVGGQMGFSATNTSNYNSRQYTNSAWTAMSRAVIIKNDGNLCPDINILYSTACEEQDAEESGDQK